MAAEMKTRRNIINPRWCLLLNGKHIYANHCLKYTHWVVYYFAAPSANLWRRNQKKYFEKKDCDAPTKPKEKKDKGDKDDKKDKGNKGDKKDKGDNKRPAKNNDHEDAPKKKIKKDK